MKKILFILFLSSLVLFPLLAEDLDMVNEIKTQNALINAVEKVSPAVVSINTIVESTGADIFNPMSFEFYNKPKEGQGSGVIVDERGYIITNEHVIKDASKIFVTLSDGRQLGGVLVGSDPDTDLALIYVNGTDLPAAPLGTSEGLKPGAWAIAIGNPFGLSNSVTVGFVSAVNRSLKIEDNLFESLIQTDASINPGNSGGALVDIYGNVIGINTAIAAQGIGFAVPVDIAKEIIAELIEYGDISRGYVGFYTVEVNLKIATQLRLPDARGLLVVEVMPGGPGERAGLKTGDVIREVNGTTINKVMDLKNIIKEIGIGEILDLYIYREGYVGTLHIFVEEEI
jgi:S1-C subfamily serine protease